MIIAKKSGRGFRFSDTIWESLSAAQKAEFSGVEKLAPAVRASNAKRAQVPPEVVAMVLSCAFTSACWLQSCRLLLVHSGNGHGVIGRGENEEDEPDRELGFGLKHIKKTRSKK